MYNSLLHKNMINKLEEIGNKNNFKKIKRQLVIIMFKLLKSYMEKILKIIYSNKMEFYRFKKKMLEQQDLKMIIFLKSISF